MSDQLQHKRQPPKQQQPDKRLSAAFVRNASEPGHYSDGNCLYLVIGDDVRRLGKGIRANSGWPSASDDYGRGAGSGVRPPGETRRG